MIAMGALGLLLGPALPAAADTDTKTLLAEGARAAAELYASGSVAMGVNAAGVYLGSTESPRAFFGVVLFLAAPLATGMTVCAVGGGVDGMEGPRCGRAVGAAILSWGGALLGTFACTALASTKQKCEWAYLSIAGLPPLSATIAWNVWRKNDTSERPVVMPLLSATF
jgi:hypothetical protein